MVTFAVRRAAPVTVAEWERRFDLDKLGLVREVDFGRAVECPKCHALTTTARIYRDGNWHRVFARCGCGHCWEPLGQG